MLNALSGGQTTSGGSGLDLLAVLIGALIGGVATFAASWWQTKRVLEHERQQARQALADERQAARDAMTRDAARELLEALAELVTCIPGLKNRHRSQPRTLAERSLHAAERVQQLSYSAASLIPETVRNRWFELSRLSMEIGEGDDLADIEAHRRYSDEAMLAEQRRGAWPDGVRDRGEHDLRSYCQYVHRSLVALLDDTELPARAYPPVLRRPDRAVWQAPDQPYYVGEDDIGPRPS